MDDVCPELTLQQWGSLVFIFVVDSLIQRLKPFSSSALPQKPFTNCKLRRIYLTESQL